MFPFRHRPAVERLSAASSRQRFTIEPLEDRLALSAQAVGNTFSLTEARGEYTRLSSMVVRPDGEFFVIESTRASGSEANGLAIHRFSPQGLAVGDAVRILPDPWYESSIIGAAIGVAPNGEFVVAMQVRREVVANHIDILIQRYDADGQAVGTVTQLAQIPHYLASVDLAMNSAGEYVVSWSSSIDPASYFQRFDANGQIVGDVLSMDDGQWQDFTLEEDGDLMIIGSPLPSAGIYGVIVRRVEESGQISDYIMESDVPYLPMPGAEKFSIAADGSGGSVIAWVGHIPNTDSEIGLMARRIGGLVLQRT